MMAWIFRSAKWSAIVGGLVLCAITLMSVASITGRALIRVGLGPVPGDFEMVEPEIIPVDHRPIGEQ